MRKKEELLSKKDRVLTHGSRDDLNRRKYELKIVLKKLVKLNKAIGGKNVFCITNKTKIRRKNKLKFNITRFGQ